MNRLRCSRWAVCSCVAAAMLAGCGESQPPIGGLGAMPQTSAIPTHAEHGKSWMPSYAASQNLLYVSEVRTVAVYSYPQRKREGTLRHFYIATGMCADKKGDVFVVDSGYGKIFEYAHGGTKRLVTLDSPTKGPVGCAIDPTTGDLAVGSQGFGSEATIAIYKNARGKPVTYTDSAFDQFFFCGYDNKGNLFADGLTAPGSGNFALAELPQGKTALTTITVDRYITFPGGVQWDGKHLAIGNQFTNIYEFAISGHRATSVGTTQLGRDAMYVKQFWIQGQTVIAPNVYIPKGHSSRSNVLFYDYPAGKKATQKITDGVKGAQGAVVSLAAK
jgi:hypothetical protein